MSYFIEDVLMLSLHRCFKIPDEDLQNEICNATSLIQYIALACNGEKDTCNKLHVQAKCILNSILFLSKNDVAKTLTALVEIFEKLNCRIVTVSLVYNDICLSILNENAFGAVLCISISNLLRKYVKSASNDSILICLAQCILKNLNSLITSQLSSYFLSTLLLLIKNCSNIDSCQRGVLNQMYLYLKTGHCKQAVKLSDEILGVVIKRMNGKEKVSLFKQINTLPWWDKGECVMIIHLMNYWPASVDIDLYLREMAPHLAAILLENITDYAVKILKLAINRMDFETWNSVLIPNIVNMVLSHFDSNWELITKTLAQCVNLGVQRFETKVYTKIDPNLLETCYLALVLHYSVHKGCLNVVDYQNEIDILIHSPDYINQSYGIKTVCIFNNKRSELTSWHIEHVKFYLQNSVFSLGEVCFKELHYFLSHVNVRANTILNSNENVEVLRLYVDFVRWLYEFSMSMLLSRSLKGVRLGSELFNLLRNIICNSSEYLKTKYNLDETDKYDQKKSAFYNHLWSVRAWKYNDNDLEVIANEFLSSQKVFPELCSIIENWDGVSSNRALKVKGKAFSVLGSKRDKETVSKAEHCMSLSLNNAKTDTVMRDILSEWKRVTGNFSKLDIVDVDEILTVYSLTVFMSTLLRRDLVPKSEYPAVLLCCERIIKKLIRTKLDNPHATKGVEQTFVTIMNILCSVIKSSSKKPFDVCFELVNEVIEQGSGKSVTCAAASAIHAMCASAFESSDDAQTALNNYLESVLFSIYDTPEVKLSTIRRNPEHRLTINAIATAETYRNRVFLTRSMSFILDVLDNPFSGNSAKASALHTLEILMSNSSIHNETFEYVSPTAIRAMKEFSSSDWNVKNGAIQVLQALINRLVGQKNNSTQRRRYGMDDLLVLYPDLMKYCHRQVYGPITEKNCDSVIAILALFSESFYSSFNMCHNRDVSFIVESFQKSFIKLIRTDSNVGVFAAKAYAALHPLTNVSDVVCDIVRWIKENFHCIGKNVFAAVISLLECFLNKFDVFFMSKDNIESVSRSLLDLKMFFKRYSCKYEFSLFNILAVVIYDVLELKSRIIKVLRQEETYETRLWLNTNLRYVLNGVEIEEYPALLKQCFSCEISITLQRHCIESVIDRYYELQKHSLVNSVVDAFVYKFVSLESKNYILISFCECLLMLLEGSHCYSCSTDTLLQFRDKCLNTFNIYFLSVYVALLSYCPDYSENDELFLRNAVNCYVDQLAKRDVEMQIFVASTLTYLFNFVDVAQRPIVLNFAFILLLDPASSTEICKFIAFLFNQNLSGTYETLLSLVSAENLRNCLYSKQNIFDFLAKLKQFVNNLGDEFEDCGMFYMKQNDHICSYKQSLLNILEVQLEIVAKMC